MLWCLHTNPSEDHAASMFRVEVRSERRNNTENLEMTPVLPDVCGASWGVGMRPLFCVCVLSCVDRDFVMDRPRTRSPTK